MAEHLTVGQRAELRRLAQAAASEPWGHAAGEVVFTNHSRFHTTTNLAARVVELLDAADRADAAEAEATRLGYLLDGLAHDDGDLKASGEWVAKRFREVVAERDAARQNHEAYRLQEKELRAIMGAPVHHDSRPTVLYLKEIVARRDAAEAKLSALQACYQEGLRDDRPRSCNPYGPRGQEYEAWDAGWVLRRTQGENAKLRALLTESRNWLDIITPEDIVGQIDAVLAEGEG